MKRLLTFLGALLIACSFSVFWAAPAVLGKVGPCSIRVHTPDSSGATRYYYELEGETFSRELRVDSPDGSSALGQFRDLPPGSYTLRCDGITLGCLTVTLDSPDLELWPNSDWPVFSPR